MGGGGGISQRDNGERKHGDRSVCDPFAFPRCLSIRQAGNLVGLRRNPGHVPDYGSPLFEKGARAYCPRGSRLNSIQNRSAGAIHAYEGTDDHTGKWNFCQGF